MGAPGRHTAPSGDRRRGWVVVVLVVAGLVAFAGGYVLATAGDEEEAVAPSLAATPSDAGAVSDTAPTATDTPAPTQATQPPVLEDGLHFVQPTSIAALDDGSFQLTFDLGYFYTGGDAFAYAEEHDLELTNDYVIVNDNPRLRTMAFAEDAAVLYIPLGTCCELVDGSVDALAGSVNGTEQTDYPDPETTWWFITVESGRVTEIVQQYLP